MRNKLMITTAVAALIGCTTLAVAQETKEAPSKATPSTQGAQQHPGGAGGAMSHPQSGNEMKPGGGAAQNMAPKAGAEPQQGQAQERSGQGGAENHGVSQSEQSNPNSATNRRGAQEERGTQEQRGAQEQPRGTQEQRGAQSNEQRGAQSNEPNKTGESQQNAQGTAGRTNKAGGGASVQLSQEQRTKIKDVVVKDRNVARVDHVDFSVSVGVTVPRTVHVAVLPADVVTIVPEYRDFDYIIVGDQLLIIDPHTMDIVAILPA
jgi:hypothetical protein